MSFTGTITIKENFENLLTISSLEGILSWGRLHCHLNHLPVITRVLPIPLKLQWVSKQPIKHAELEASPWYWLWKISKRPQDSVYVTSTIGGFTVGVPRTTPWETLPYAMFSFFHCIMLFWILTLWIFLVSPGALSECPN
jgi:hypothetical protein